MSERSGMPSLKLGLVVRLRTVVGAGSVCALLAGTVLAAREAIPAPANRYSCVAASASLACQYFGKTRSNNVNLFEKLDVDREGAASVGCPASVGIGQSLVSG